MPVWIKYTFGAPGEIRTHDPRFRRPILYPAELRVHILLFLIFMHLPQETGGRAIMGPPQSKHFVGRGASCDNAKLAATNKASAAQSTICDEVS